jgi:hypothetical protein
VGDFDGVSGFTDARHRIIDVAKAVRRLNVGKTDGSYWRSLGDVEAMGFNGFDGSS